MHAIDEVLQTQIWQVAEWTEARQIGAATQLALDVALAHRNEALSIANATYARDEQWADAVRDRQIALNAAKSSQVLAQAALRNSTLQTWNLSEQTNWSQYQSDLASNALTQIDNFVSATGFANADLALAPVQADQQYDERDDQARHARDRALAIAGAEWSRAIVDINADGGLRLLECAEKWNATILAEAEYRDMRDDHADADWQYSYDVAAAAWQQTRDTCDRGNDRLISLANAESNLLLSGVTAPLPADVVQYDLDITTANNTHRDDLADVLHTYQSDVIAAEATRAASKVEANYDYRKDVNELEATARINVATAAKVFAQAKAIAQQNFAVTDANALHLQQTLDAFSHHDRRQQVALAQQAFLNVESAQSAVRRIADATARHAFESSEAWDETTLLTFWDSTENTPWSEYQADLARSTFDFVDQVGLAVIADVTSSATQEDVWQQAVNGLNSTYEISLADAERDRAIAAADHTRNLSQTKASETQTRSYAVALETKDHDVGVANATWGLEDDVAAADSLQQSQQNDALWTYKGTVADEDRDLTKTINPQTTHDANVQAALTTRLISEGTALVTRTNTVGNKQVAWTASTNLLDFIWTINVDTAFNTFATNVRNAMVNDYAADEQTSDIALATANANAEYARTLGFIPIDTAFGSATTNADTLWSSSLDDELADYREELVDDWGEYEESLYTAHFTTQQAEFLSTSDPLDGYQAAYAQTESAIATAMRTQRNAYHDDVTLANETYTDNRNAQRLLALPIQQLADTTATFARAAQTTTLTTGTAYAQQTHDGTVADADRFQADIGSETSYSDAAIVHRNSNRLSQANFNKAWANNVATAASTLHQAQYSYSATTAFNGTKASETLMRGANIRTTNLSRINNIGTTQTTRGTSLGNNEIAQVTTYGNAGVTLSGSLTTAEDNHDLAVQTIESAHRSTTLGLWSSDQLDDATQQQLLTSSLGNAGISFLNNLRPNLLTTATTLANAEAAYHLSLATNAANEAATNAITLGTPAAQFEADAATAKLTWLQQIAPAFVTFVNASALAEANASRDLALADRDFQNNAASEEFNFLTTVLPLMTGLANSSAINSDTLHNNLSDESQAHRLSSSTAELTHGVSGSTANKQHRVDRAGNRQTYETAQENADQNAGAGQSTFFTSEADTELSRAASSTGIAETDKTWRYDLAAADKTQSRNNATHQKNSQIAQAGLQQTFSNSEAAAAGTYDLALAAHEQTYGTATLVADITRATALGNAQLAWLNASYSADSFALMQLDTLNTDASDWTTHLVQLAGAKQTWWTTFSPNFTSLINNITAEWTTEQTTANTELASMALLNHTADLTYAADIATATFDATTFLAAQSELKEFALADADELFQQSEATARRTFDTTKATITRDTTAVGSTPLAPGATVIQATAAQKSARDAAKLTFDNTTALPVAGFSVTQSATNHWWTTQTNAAASTHATARATALDDFLTNTSEATRLQRSNSATLAATLDQNRATDFAAAIGAFATTNPTPWATFAVSKANAELARTTTIAPARATHDSGLAQADHDYLSELANSLAQYIKDQTTLDNNDLLTAANDDLSSSILGANNFLNPPGSTSSTDILTAVNVPGSTMPGAPSGFTFNTNAAPRHDFAFFFAAVDSRLRNAPAQFGPTTADLPDSHVEPSTATLPRARMLPGHSGSVAWLDPNQPLALPTNSTTPNNSANPGNESKKSVTGKVSSSPQVISAVDRAAGVGTQKRSKAQELATNDVDVSTLRANLGLPSVGPLTEDQQAILAINLALEQSRKILAMVPEFRKADALKDFNDFKRFVDAATNYIRKYGIEAFVQELKLDRPPTDPKTLTQLMSNADRTRYYELMRQILNLEAYSHEDRNGSFSTRTPFQEDLLRLFELQRAELLAKYDYSYQGEVEDRARDKNLIFKARYLELLAALGAAAQVQMQGRTTLGLPGTLPQAPQGRQPSELPPTTQASVVDKLQRYLLNASHPEGGPKARWFEEALGFTQKNKGELAEQIKFVESEAIQTKSGTHGVTFEQTISIRGANGKSIDVTFVFIRNQDGVVRLVTTGSIPDPE